MRTWNKSLQCVFGGFCVVSDHLCSVVLIVLFALANTQVTGLLFQFSFPSTGWEI